MDTASSLLGRAIRRAGIDQQVQGYQAQAAFADAVEATLGPAARQQAKARSLKDGALTIEVTSSPLASEVQLHTEKLIAAVNKILGHTTVQYFRIVVRPN